MFRDILMVSLILYLSSSCDITLDKSSWLSGYRIGNGVFLVLSNIGFAGCRRACRHRKICHSIDYNTDFLQCSLGKFANNTKATGNQKDFFIAPDFNDTAQDNTEPCQYRPCSKTKLCVPLFSGDYTCITEINSVDLAVLIDVSATTSSSDFEHIISSLHDVIGQLYDVRLAVAYFGNNNPEVAFGLGEYLDEQEQLNALVGQVYDKKTGDQLKEGIQLIHDIIFQEDSGDRSNVTNVLLIVVCCKDIESSGLAAAATEVKNAGIHIIAVGVDSNPNHQDGIIDMIASAPLGSNTLLVPSFYDLLYVETEIAALVKQSLV